MRGEEGCHISVLRCAYSPLLTNPTKPVITTIIRQPLFERGDEDALIPGFSILSLISNRATAHIHSIRGHHRVRCGKGGDFYK